MNKQNLLNSTVVYATLVSLTLMTWIADDLQQLSGLGLALPLLAIALLKGQLLADGFMGFAQVRSAWRWLITLWLLICGSLITLAFMLTEGS